MGKETVKKLGYFIAIVLTFLYALVMLLGACSRFVNPAHSHMMCLLGEIMPILIIVDLVLICVWAFKRRIWVIVPILGLLVNWGFLSSMLQFSIKTPARGNLKVATFNVHVFDNEYSGYTAKEVARYMERQKVDILCMQEYGSEGHFNLDSLSRVFSGWKYSYIPKIDRGHNQVAVYSRHPIIRKVFIPFGNNGAIWCDIVKGNDTVRVYALHFQTTSFNRDAKITAKYNFDLSNAAEYIGTGVMENVVVRSRQAKRIQALVKATRLPVVVCGDFNDTPASYTYQLFNEIMNDGFKSGGSGYGATYRFLHKMLRIDFIFTNDRIEPGKYTIVHEDWSDHYPVIMEMRIK